MPLVEPALLAVLLLEPETLPLVEPEVLLESGTVVDAVVSPASTPEPLVAVVEFEVSPLEARLPDVLLPVVEVADA